MLNFKSPEDIEKTLESITSGATPDSPEIDTSGYTAVLGMQLGDEGKGRVIDNLVEAIDSNKDLYVIRCQGGSNAGHTVEKDGVRIGLHQIPSTVFHENARLVLDSGMVIHPEDLVTEIGLAEQISPDISKRILLSTDAMLCTDLQRAKEVLNRKLKDKAKGGTGRGMSPTAAERYEKLGLSIGDLMADDWKETLKDKYEFYKNLFGAFGVELSETEVPDFRSTKESGEPQIRTVGDVETFLERLSSAREQFIEKDIVTDTYLKLYKASNEENTEILFEMAQGIGLSPWFGTSPDTTCTPTDITGVPYGTRLIHPDSISRRIGVIKATYMSSVGARTMPTEADDEWSNWVRDFANEYGTTTKRPRDICYLDLVFMQYNAYIGGINEIAATHLDVSKEEYPIKVCIGYERDGQLVPYKPDLKYLSTVSPRYVELPGWSSEECAKAKSFNELPKNAQRYIYFLEQVMGLPIRIITTGPDRDNIVIR